MAVGSTPSGLLLTIVNAIIELLSAFSYSFSSIYAVIRDAYESISLGFDSPFIFFPISRDFKVYFSTLLKSPRS